MDKNWAQNNCSHWKVKKKWSVPYVPQILYQVVGEQRSQSRPTRCVASFLAGHGHDEVGCLQKIVTWWAEILKNFPGLGYRPWWLGNQWLWQWNWKSVHQVPKTSLNVLLIQEKYSVVAFSSNSNGHGVVCCLKKRQWPCHGPRGVASLQLGTVLQPKLELKYPT